MPFSGKRGRKRPIFLGFSPPSEGKKISDSTQIPLFWRLFWWGTTAGSFPLCQRAGQRTKPHNMGLCPSARGTNRRKTPLFPVRRGAPPPGRRAWGAETGTPVIMRWPAKGTNPGSYGWEKTGFPVIFQEVVYRKTITVFQAFPVIFPPPLAPRLSASFQGIQDILSGKRAWAKGADCLLSTAWQMV